MLNEKLQIFIIMVALLFSGFIFNYVRKGSLELRYAIVWIIVGIAFILMALVPDIVFMVAGFAGIELASNALFFLGLLYSLIIIFTLTVTISNLSVKVTRLTQEIAILKDVVNEKLEK
ncbi:MAG: DUF2304 domain-containing protein [Candidatus Kapaibacterium sp.]